MWQDGKISAISRDLKISTAEVRKCIDQIAKLNPRPLREFGGKRNDYVVPDIIFRKDDGKWEIELNDGWVEDYHINDYYLKMMKESTDAQLGAYFQKKLERIRFVMNSIAQRRRTILQISEQILNVQEHFLDGTGFLKPMTMTDVAESLNPYFYGEPGHQRKVYPVSVRNHIDEASVYGIGFSSRRKRCGRNHADQGTDEGADLQ